MNVDNLGLIISVVSFRDWKGFCGRVFNVGQCKRFVMILCLIARNPMKYRRIEIEFPSNVD